VPLLQITLLLAYILIPPRASDLPRNCKALNNFVLHILNRHFHSHAGTTNTATSPPFLQTL
jgi:hypothetical protein